jgi:hypothetical protein
VALEKVKRTLEVWLIRNRHKGLPGSHLLNQMRLADLGVHLLVHVVLCFGMSWSRHFCFLV